MCFVGIENKSVEELRDFKDQIYQQIDTKILESQAFDPVSRRMVDAALHETRLRPDSLFVPETIVCSVPFYRGKGNPLTTYSTQY